jgi:polysaccharide biosynthesis protein PslH
MHAVIVDGDVSYPPTSGKRLRTLHLMLRLARRHRLTYIGRSNGNHLEVEQCRKFLGEHGIETILVDDPVPRKSGAPFYGRLATNLLMSDLPYSVASHRSLPMRRAIEDYAAKHQVDIWQFEWLPYMETLPRAFGRRVVVAHNVDTLLWQRYHAAATSSLKQLFLKRQWQRMRLFESTFFKQASWVVAVSPEDACIIRHDFGMPRVDVVDNGIDRAYFESVSGTRQANQILFLGALDWRPNLDAVSLLLDRIFPQVRAAEPSARLCIVGRHPSPSLTKRVYKMEGAELHADVPDVRPFLAESGVMAVPLRIGGGSRLKILEALACGLPVVSTRVGAEGLSLEPGRDFIQVDEPASMADALVQAIRAPSAALAMAAKGREVVLERYDWDVLACKLEDVWAKCHGGHHAPVDGVFSSRGA